MTDNYMNNAPVLKKPEAMVFDMDGTLFQTETLLLPASTSCLIRCAPKGFMKERPSRGAYFE